MFEFEAIRKALVNRVAGPELLALQGQLKLKTNEAYERGFNSGKSMGEAKGPDSAWEPAGFFFNKISPTGKDLELDEQREMISRAQVFYMTKGVAHRSIDLMLDYAIAQGFTYTVTGGEGRNLDLNEIMMEFWEGERNDINRTQREDMLDVLLTGELIWPTFSFVNGDVTFGYIDPFHIWLVIPEPENHKVAKWIIIESGTEYIALRIIRRFHLSEYIDPDIRVSADLRAEAIETGVKYDGFLSGTVHMEMERAILKHDVERWNQMGRLMTVDPKLDPRGIGQASCVYRPFNKPAGAVRGRSYLLHAMDHIQLDDQNYMNFIHRAAIANAFCWHIIHKGISDEGDLESKSKDLGMDIITPGKIFNTNDMVEIKALAPVLAAGDNATLEKMSRERVLGSMGLPAHWYGSGSNTNLATAKMQEDPTLQTLEGIQGMMIHAYDFMAQYQIDQKIISGHLAPRDDHYRKIFQIKGKDIRSKDDTATAQTISTTAVALSMGEEKGWISKGQASKAYKDCLIGAGYEITDEATDEEDTNMVKDNTPPSNKEMLSLQKFKESVSGLGKRDSDEVSEER